MTATDTVSATATKTSDARSTLRTHLSTAELCRQRGWGIGTVLCGGALPKEVDRRDRLIQLTAIGVQTVLAIQIWPDELPEQAWCLKTREWREVQYRRGQDPGAGG